MRANWCGFLCDFVVSKTTHFICRHIFSASLLIIIRLSASLYVRGGGGGHQWSGAHPNDKLYFWLTVGMAPPREPSSAAGPFLESSSSFPLPFLFHPCWRWRMRRRGRRRRWRRRRRRGGGSSEIWCQSHEISRSFSHILSSVRPSVPRPSAVRPSVGCPFLSSSLHSRDVLNTNC